MESITTHKTFKYKLQPTPEQEQTMAFVVRRCRELYNAALQERREAWQKCHKSIRWAHQSAELPEIKADKRRPLLGRLGAYSKRNGPAKLARFHPGWPRRYGCRRGTMPPTRPH